MECPQCGRPLDAESGRCSACAPKPEDPGGKGGTPAPGSGRPRPFRLLTSLVDRPADPGMVDDQPPASAPRALSDIGTADEGGQPGRASFTGDRLEEDAPVAPGEIRPQARERTPTREETSVSERSREQDGTTTPGALSDGGGPVEDFGEAREVSPADAERAASGAAAGVSWGSQWETDLRAQLRTTSAARCPKGGFWVRLSAFWIDSLFLSLLGSIAFAVLFSATGIQALIMANLEALERDPASAMELLAPAFEEHLRVIALTYFAVSLVAFLYRPVCHASWGRTLGKLIFGLRVVRTDGSPLGVGRAFLRYVGYIISLIPFGLGCIWVAWDGEKQGWHDKLAGTYVIKEKG